MIPHNDEKAGLWTNETSAGLESDAVMGNSTRNEMGTVHGWQAGRFLINQKLGNGTRRQKIL
jgi:hypothetical protein